MGILAPCPANMTANKHRIDTSICSRGGVDIVLEPQTGDNKYSNGKYVPTDRRRCTMANGNGFVWRPAFGNAGAHVAALALFWTVAADAAPLDPNNPEDALKISRKIICGSLEDGKTRYAVWEGQGYSRVQGEPDRLLFKVVGVNTRQCLTVSDADRGEGFKSVSREVMLYLDPDSGDVLRQWNNPWTGKQVDVIHVANDPVNMREPRFAYGKDGTPMKVEGGVVGSLFLTTSEVPLFYDNPLSGAYQLNVGRKYQAIELFNRYLDAEALLDRNRSESPRLYLSWARVSQWLPWMEMGGREGAMMFHTRGYSIENLNEMQPVLRAELDANYPEYLMPPPLDDDRPNETSWTFFKKQLDLRADRENP